MGKQRRKHAMQSFVRLPGSVSRMGIGLIDQQMWCWGCDVRRAEGNLLIQYGFTKRPASEPRYHSAYTLYGVIPDGALTLWGWGLWIAAPEHGSLFISRDRFRVRWIPQTDLAPAAWQERDLPRGCMDIRFSDAYLLLHAAFLWIAAYERWVAESVELCYRVSTLSAWPQRRRFKGGTSTKAIADQWEEIAAVLLSTYLDQQVYRSEHGCV
jgi:hypothetical protein